MLFTIVIFNNLKSIVILRLYESELSFRENINRKSIIVFKKLNFFTNITTHYNQKYY